MALAIDNAFEAAKRSINFTINRVDDWHCVVSEGKAFREECELILHIIDNVANKQFLPIRGILQEVAAITTRCNAMIDDFVDNDERQRSFFSRIEWTLQRPYRAYKHRDTFKAAAERLVVCKKKIQETLLESSQINKPTVYWYRGDMVNEESFVFWKDICGEEVQAPSWSIITDAYQLRYNVDWDSSIVERIRRVARGDGTHLTISGYIILTKLCGFPLNVEKLPLITDSHIPVSAQTRTEVVRMINKLITFYSTKKMRNLMVAIFTWYKGCNQRDQVAWQERANEWAYVMMANHGKPIGELSELGKLAEQVDMARRTYSSFFQRYMAISKIGQFSKDIFAELDFPGSGRTLEFINYVRPLDHANFHVMMHGKPEDWEAKEPTVYKFLMELLESENEAVKSLAIDNDDPFQDSEVVESLAIGTGDPFQDSEIQLIIQ